MSVAMPPSALGAAKSGAAASGARAPEAGLDSALWAGMAGADDAQLFAQSWLAIQCRMIPAVSGGLVLLRAERDTSYAPAAVWPDVRRDMRYLTPVAQRALAERCGFTTPRAGESDAPAGHFVAYPVEAVGMLQGVVVLDLAPRPDADLQAALRQLHWGAAGLALFFARNAVAKTNARRERLQSVLEIVAAGAVQERFTAAAMAIANELATRLRCDRVSIGLFHGRKLRVDAVSHSAQFQERTNLMRAVAAAMEEAIDQSATVAYPAVGEGAPAVNRAHEALMQGHGGGATLTVPLMAGSRACGALTLERPAERPFDADTVGICEAVAGLAGPMLDVHRREDHWLLGRAIERSGETLRKLLGPRHAGLKLGAILVTTLLAFMSLGKGTFRVSATTLLEPLVQQAAVAPFDGYIREAPARAGDIVEAGAVLARLDDRELRLERLKWMSQEEEFSKQFRQAMADRNPAQVQIVTAQLEQARAQAARANDQLERTTIAAPFDGIVVAGDLTQQLGAPVEKGKVLFEVAPLASFRVVIKADERDVAYVQAGQRGALLLSAFPHDPIEFTVSQVTPVSEPRDGRNTFRVEAELAAAEPRLRPGMQGVGKVEIGEARYVWIWSREIVDWLRLAAWKWLP
ncbi:MAG: HlyD family efflux transporter periplasmic adaptor subunit [Burkholderiales bacterium]|nr:HlyD family efflux transporter periplasmic adaptor subunit [Burkholderiales bacterium]